MWREMMQPRTPLRYRSPFLMPYPRQPCTPAHGAERGGVSVAACGRRVGTVQGLGSAATRANRGSVRNCVCALPCKQPSVRGVQHTGRPKPWVCRVGLPSRHSVGAACRLQPPCSLPALGGVLRPPSLSASASENRRSYELGHYRQSRLPVCPNRATTGSVPSAAACRLRCRGPCPARAARIQGAFTHPSTSSASRDPA